jgi:hypothetical protein
LDRIHENLYGKFARYRSGPESDDIIPMPRFLADKVTDEVYTVAFYETWDAFMRNNAYAERRSQL